MEGGVEVILEAIPWGRQVVAEEIITKLFSREETSSSWNGKCVSLEQ